MKFNFSYLFGRQTLGLLNELNKNLGSKHLNLLRERVIPKKYGYREDTKWIREENWKAVGPNRDILRRHCEITGPSSDAKMMINALNSDANCYMTDLEDSMSPSWENVMKAHHNIHQAIRGKLSYRREDGKEYKLNNVIKPVLFTRLRGLHLFDSGLINRGSLSATFVDFATYLSNNSLLIENNKSRMNGGIYFYMPKLQTYEEALLVKDMFEIGEEYMGLKKGTIRVTCLVETYPAIFETDEILYALKDYACGLNCGRWDYLFSLIKSNMDFNIPDRSLLTMDKKFLTAYIERIVQSCHKRGVHAMGGMSAFIPTGNDGSVIDKIIQDKELEMRLGCDGAWVAHPGLIGIVKDLFAKNIGDNQYNKIPERVIDEKEYLDIPEEMLKKENFTEKEYLNNLNVALQYLAGWLYGNGAVALNGLMEDMATCEISLYQVKQWVRNEVEISGKKLDENAFRQSLKLEREKLERGEGLQVKYAKHLLIDAETCIGEYVLNMDKHFLPDVASEYLA